MLGLLLLHHFVKLVIVYHMEKTSLNKKTGIYVSPVCLAYTVQVEDFFAVSDYETKEVNSMFLGE